MLKLKAFGGLFNVSSIFLWLFLCEWMGPLVLPPPPPPVPRPAVRIRSAVCVWMNRIVGSDLSCMSTVVLRHAQSSDLMPTATDLWWSLLDYLEKVSSFCYLSWLLMSLLSEGCGPSVVFQFQVHSLLFGETTPALQVSFSSRAHRLWREWKNFNI